MSSLGKSIHSAEQKHNRHQEVPEWQMPAEEVSLEGKLLLP